MWSSDLGRSVCNAKAFEGGCVYMFLGFVQHCVVWIMNRFYDVLMHYCVYALIDVIKY